MADREPATSKPTARAVAPEELRSHRWYGVPTLRAFGHRSRTAQMGYDKADYAGKPVIGIVNTWSDIGCCHAHFPERVEAIKRGIWQAGGFPIVLPAQSLSEPFVKPSTMMYRNFLAMETEELIRCHPIDGVVLMGGCDKTTPALIMGATTMNLPAIFFPAGPMLRGTWRGQVLGSGSDVWKYWAELRAGTITEEDWAEIEQGIARSPGTCMTMGTAATMMSLADALGMTLPGASSLPAADSRHSQMAGQVGRRIVDMVWEDLRPRKVLTPAAFRNAITVDMALGGSTNAIIHLVAMAGRAGVDLPLEDFDALSRTTPFLANIRPSGKYLMEDFYYAGGIRALIAGLGDRIDRSCLTVNGRTIGENLQGAEVWKGHEDVIRTPATALSPEGGTVILRGNLAPDGAVIKQSAAEPHLLVHSGPAVVFKDYNDMAARIDDPELDVTKDSVLVLQSAGPLGGPGMPEWGQLPIPKKLLQQGVRDMVRISDARMSGTSYGACVLHVAPESHVGGPLALVRTGDRITLDVPNRRLNVEITDDEMAARRARWTAPKAKFPRGYGAMYSAHVTQANTGCDFDFLHETEETVAEPEIH